MADDNTDMLMKFVIDPYGSGIAAECQTFLDWKNDMIWDFDNGQFFEVEQFRFGMNLNDDESKDKASDGPQRPASLGGSLAGVQAGRMSGQSLRDAAAAANRAAAQPQPGKDAPPKSKFQRWKSMKPGQPFTPPYRFVLDVFNFTRLFDKASPILFQRCCNSLSFDSATLVKRKVTGDAKLQAFLRMDFDKVLITKLDWKDGEVIKEDCSFVFRGFKMQYVRQQMTGKLDNSTMQVDWAYTLDLADPDDED